MINHLRNAPLLALCALTAGSVYPASAATYSAVAYLTSQDSAPIGIVEGSPSVFFAQAGGAIIFSVTTQGATTVVASFATPPYIVESAPGAMGANSLFYSSVSQTTIGPGSGNMFSVTAAAGSEKIYSTLGLVMNPLAGNLPDGKLFGLVYDLSNGTLGIGTSDLSGNVATIYQFPGTDRPNTPIYGADGSYYGTAITYGTPNGYFYKVTPSGSFTKVATLPFLGDGIVMQATDGNFYGVQGPNFTTQQGAVYKMTPAGVFTTLHEFGVSTNGIVNSLIEGSDGKLYGATQGNSTIFSLTATGAYKLLFKTTNGITQGLCTCIVTQGSDGITYGTALGGGTSGAGLIFALNADLPVPKPQARQFTPASGAAGTKVRIWGYNLFGASVEFNGVPATEVYNSGSNYVWATVPTGATTGPLTITTPGGTATTKASFTVE